MFELSNGKSDTKNTIATKSADDDAYENCLMTTKVMTAGKYRISMKNSGGQSGVMLGVAKDGAAPDKDHCESESEDAWFMFPGLGCLYGHGKSNSDAAGDVHSNQVLSMELDLDAGSLKFWVDGKPHGPGWSSGVTGSLRWAACVRDKGTSVQIVPTPELEPWAEWEGSNPSACPLGFDPFSGARGEMFQSMLRQMEPGLYQEIQEAREKRAAEEAKTTEMDGMD